LLIGVALLIAADLVLAFVPGLLGLGLGVALWGLHMGFTQGLFNVLIADNAPAELRGTAFGMFHLLTGVALLLASVIAGVLWDTRGFQGTSAAGAVFAFLTVAGLITLRRSAQGAFCIEKADFMSAFFHFIIPRRRRCIQFPAGTRSSPYPQQSWCGPGIRR